MVLRINRMRVELIVVMGGDGKAWHGGQRKLNFGQGK